MFIEIKNFVFDIDEATHCLLTKDFFRVYSQQYKSNMVNGSIDGSIKIENCENLYNKICEIFVKNGFVKIRERERVWLINKRLIYSFELNNGFYRFSLGKESPPLIIMSNNNELEVECIKNLCFEDRTIIE